jgi:predicted RNA-binding Zn ribbon-like protein
MRRTRKSQPFEQPSRAGALELVGGMVALDLTNTSSGRDTPAHQEHLRDFDTAMEWVAHTGVIAAADCAYIRQAAASRPKWASAIFKRVIELRELIWMIATALAEQRPVAGKLLASLATMHARNLRFVEMKLSGGAYIWSWNPRRNAEAAILGPITLSAVTLLMEKDTTRTKRCAGLECGWLYFDTTKNNRRRWCEMRVCGNRAKVRAARMRRKPAAGPLRPE